MSFCTRGTATSSSRGASMRSSRLAACRVDFFVQGHSFGLSIIEALDTLYVMELDDELHACVGWLRTHLDFDIDGNVQMFEAVIRMVAGLLAGYYATGERFMLDGARELADRLLVCFTKSPTGAPYRFANLRTGAVSAMQRATSPRSLQHSRVRRSLAL